MSRLERVFLGILFALLGFTLWTPAGAGAATLPVSMNLSADPATVKWPEKRDFKYRLEATAGSEGADFEFAAAWAAWNLPGVVGSPWVTESAAELDGPGELKRGWTLVADPSPVACFRGGFQSTRQSWRLTIPPGESTSVTIPARLIAAPVAGMNTQMKLEISDPAEGPTLTAPLKIEGTEGVRILIDSTRRKAKLGQHFVLKGRTIPAVPNTWVEIVGQPRMWGGNGEPPRTDMKLAVKTDRQGRFKSRPVSLDSEATWVLTSKLRDPTPYDGGSSCNGTIAVSEGWYRPNWIDLKGSRFMSTKIKGWDMGKKNRLSLSFYMAPRFSPNIPNMKNWPRVPHVSPHTGCNSMSGEVTVKNGKIRIPRGFLSTMMFCMPNNDGWAHRLFSKGVSALAKGEMLVIKQGKTKILMKRRS